MPVYPFEPVAALKSGDYRHMSYRDVEIWERFLDVYAEELEGVVYDVALGGIEPPDGLGDEPTRRSWRYSTAIKVDVVLVTADAVWTAEVKPRASCSAIGQALCAAELLELDGSVKGDIIPTVITDVASPDTRYLCDRFGVELIEVGYVNVEVSPAGGAP